MIPKERKHQKNQKTMAITQILKLIISGKNPGKNKQNGEQK